MERRWLERVAERLLALCAGGDGWWLIGDLREELARRTAADGEHAARRWYLREVLGSIPPLLRRRLTTTPAPTPDPMSSLLRTDLGYAWRVARRSPLSSTAIVLTMVIGIGATSAVFTVVNAVLLRPLPFPHSERAVKLTSNIRGNTGGPLAYPDLLDIRSRVSSFSDVAGVSTMRLTLQQGDRPEQVDAIRADDAYGRIFGIRPMLGRYFTREDLEIGATRVVILTQGFWRRSFGADSAIVGRTITMNNVPYTVIGVLPEMRFLYPMTDADMMVPLRVQPGSMFVNRAAMWIDAVASLRDGVPRAQAAAELDRVTRAMIVENPRTNVGITAELAPLRDTLVGDVRQMLMLLVLAMAGVLTVACLNVGNLLLGKAQARGREFAIRAAIGGSATRLRWQIFAEGFLLASIGGGLGLLIAPGLSGALLAVYPSGLPRAEEVGIDLRVLAVTVGATITAGILSVVPLARRAGRIDLVTGLREGGRSGATRSARQSASMLVVAQVATCVALLFASTLLITTFVKLNRLDLGFEPAGTLTFRLAPRYPRVQTSGDVERYFATIAERIGQLPGVEAVASATQIPMGEAFFGDVFERKELGDRGTANPSAQVAAVSVGFDRALGMKLVRGRTFTPADDSAGARVVMIDETLARTAWPGVDPLGRLIDWNREDWRVVGIVRATRDRDVWEDPAPHLYAPSAQRFGQDRYVVVRASVPPSQLVGSIQRTIKSFDPTIAVFDIATMEERMGSALAAQRFRALLVATIAALTLSLCALGIYSVVAYAVTQRRREIGIRMALGETGGEVRQRILRGAVATCAGGAAIGIVLALGIGRWLTTFLFDVAPTDLRALAAVSIGIVSLGALAAYMPARRASRIDPVGALRGE